jgi:hypothetical protein
VTRSALTVAGFSLGREECDCRWPSQHFFRIGTYTRGPAQIFRDQRRGSVATWPCLLLVKQGVFPVCLPNSLEIFRCGDERDAALATTPTDVETYGELRCGRELSYRNLDLSARETEFTRETTEA